VGRRLLGRRRRKGEGDGGMGILTMKPLWTINIHYRKQKQRQTNKCTGIGAKLPRLKF
jgi:hypothetical protein